MHLLPPIFVALLSLCMFGSGALADDLPFGGDALRVLSREADAVVRSTEPRRVAADSPATVDPARAKYALYAVKVEEVLSGAVESGSQIRVALPEALDVQQIDQLSNAILFLRRLEAEDLKKTNIGLGKDTYLVVSGRYGVVDAAVPNRKAAVQAYVSASRPEAARGERVLSWTEQYAQSTDPFLQRSAMVDLYHERANARAIQQLDAALRSDSVTPSSKRTAIKALAASGTTSAAAPLKDLAENDKIQRILREDAVKAFKNIPGGQDQLQLWSASPDHVLSTTADKAIRDR